MFKSLKIFLKVDFLNYFNRLYLVVVKNYKRPIFDLVEFQIKNVQMKKL